MAGHFFISLNVAVDFRSVCALDGLFVVLTALRGLQVINFADVVGPQIDFAGKTGALNKAYIQFLEFKSQRLALHAGGFAFLASGQARGLVWRCCGRRRGYAGVFTVMGQFEKAVIAFQIIAFDQRAGIQIDFAGKARRFNKADITIRIFMKSRGDVVEGAQTFLTGALAIAAGVFAAIATRLMRSAAGMRDGGTGRKRDTQGRGYLFQGFGQCFLLLKTCYQCGRSR